MSNSYDKITAANRNSFPRTTNGRFTVYSWLINKIIGGENTLKADTISEVTDATGVTIDTMLIKDGIPYADTIAEATAGAGVTVDGLKIKDGAVQTSLDYIVGADSIDDAGNLTLTQAQSGMTLVLDIATGLAVTLPATPSIGTKYKIITKVDLSSGSYTVTTGNGVYIGGLNFVDDTTPESATMFKAGGTDNAITLNGTTTGGEIGTVIELVYQATDVWMVSGLVAANGTIATPFSTV